MFEDIIPSNKVKDTVKENERFAIIISRSQFHKLTDVADFGTLCFDVSDFSTCLAQRGLRYTMLKKSYYVNSTVVELAHAYS